MDDYHPPDGRFAASHRRVSEGNAKPAIFLALIAPAQRQARQLTFLIFLLQILFHQEISRQERQSGLALSRL